MSYKRLVFIIVLISILIFPSCNKYIILVDDSSKNVVSFAIDSSKISNSYKLIEKCEEQIITGIVKTESLLPGLSMKDVCQDLRIMLDNPNSTIIGNSGHYCGIAVVLNWLLNNQPEKYTKAVLELAYKGETQFVNSTSKIKLPKALRSKVDYSISGKTKIGLIRQDIDSTSISDFILGVSMVYSEKGFQKLGLISPKATYKKKSWGSFVFANTMPWEMDDYFRKAGVNIIDKGFYLGDNEDIEVLLKIEEAVKQGRMPLIFDNHFISYARTKNFLYRFTGAHFITIHSFKVDQERKVVNFTYWDYGRVKNNPFLTRTIRPFRTGNMRKDIKRSKKFRKKGLDIQKREITTAEFLKSMKGYWIPED